MPPGRTAIIKGINTPISFFVLALLIVESFLSLIILGSEISEQYKLIFIWLGAGLFLIVVTFVFILILKNKVKDLTYDKEAHLRSESRKQGGSTD